MELALARFGLPHRHDRTDRRRFGPESTVELEEEIIRRVPLYDNWAFFLLFVGVIGVEWFLRKKWGLV